MPQIQRAPAIVVLCLNASDGTLQHHHASDVLCEAQPWLRADFSFLVIPNTTPAISEPVVPLGVGVVLSLSRKELQSFGAEVVRSLSCQELESSGVVIVWCLESFGIDWSHGLLKSELFGVIVIQSGISFGFFIFCFARASHKQVFVSKKSTYRRQHPCSDHLRSGRPRSKPTPVDAESVWLRLRTPSDCDTDSGRLQTTTDDYEWL